jgi:hypothetical protein
MRKIVLALLVLLLTVPAMATVEVRCAQVSDTDQVTVTYDVDDGNNFRAFGIEISVDNGASISNLDVNDRDYYIFPGSIDINDAGGVDDWGSAIAAQDSNSFILEMGSLYAAEDPCHTTAPPTSGLLCSFYVSGDCNVAIANDAARGGVVMEDLDFAGSVDLIGCSVDYDKCMSSAHPDYVQWGLVGEPNGWCASYIPRQCHGDADGRSQGKANYWVSTWDLDVLVGAWNKSYALIAGQTVLTGGGDNVPMINADFDHLPQGKGNYRVSTWDLDILVASWNQGGLPDPNCP